MILFYLAFCNYKLMLQILSLRRTPQVFDPAAVPPGGWPRYTLMVPLYHEERAVPGLMAHFAAHGLSRRPHADPAAGGSG